MSLESDETPWEEGGTDQEFQYSEQEWDSPAEDEGGAAEGEQAEWPEWVEVIDDELGLPYYFNTVTGESVWEKPEAMLAQEQAEAAEETSETAGDVAAEEQDDRSGVLEEEERKQDDRSGVLEVEEKEEERPHALTEAAVAAEPELPSEEKPVRHRFDWGAVELLPRPPAHRSVQKVYGSVVATKGATIPRFLFVGLPSSMLRPVVPIPSLPQRSGALQKRGGGRSLFGSRRWQKRWFVLYGRVLRYFKKPQSVVTALGSSMDTTAREQLKFYSSRGTGVKKAPSGRRVQDAGEVEELGSFEAGDEASRIVAQLRATDMASHTSASLAQGSHMQRTALMEHEASPKTADQPLGRVPLYGGWVRCVPKGTPGFVDSGFLLLPAEGNRVFELSAANDDLRRAWVAALVAAGCREITD
jgi:hypothetical protein